MKKKILQNFRIVFDSFDPEGNYPLISLQHPTKEIEESYMLITIEDNTIAELIQYLEDIDRLWFQSYINATIEYIEDKKTGWNIIRKLNINKIIIEDERNLK